MSVITFSYLCIEVVLSFLPSLIVGIPTQQTCRQILRIRASGFYGCDVLFGGGHKKLKKIIIIKDWGVKANYSTYAAHSLV